MVTKLIVWSIKYTVTGRRRRRKKEEEAEEE